MLFWIKIKRGYCNVHIIQKAFQLKKIHGIKLLNVKKDTIIYIFKQKYKLN